MCALIAFSETCMHPDSPALVWLAALGGNENVKWSCCLVRLVTDITDGVAYHKAPMFAHGNVILVFANYPRHEAENT